MKRALRRRLAAYCAATYPTKLDMVAKQVARPLFNHRCHWNADALVRSGEAVAIVECLLIDSSSASVHYVALQSDMRCFDPTLGAIYAGGDYRLLEVLRGFDNNDPDARLRATKDRLARAGLPWPLYKLYDSGDLL